MRIFELLQEAGGSPKDVGRRWLHSPEFRRWFGNSKVVDADGDPVVVFHGSLEDIHSFSHDFNDFGGFFFTANPSYAATHIVYNRGGENGYYLNPCYLSIQNPLEVWPGPDEFGYPKYERATIRDAKAAGHDGVFFHDKRKGRTFYVAFEPRQIKSLHNRGTFDPNNPVIKEVDDAAL